MQVKYKLFLPAPPSHMWFSYVEFPHKSPITKTLILIHPDGVGRSITRGPEFLMELLWCQLNEFHSYSCLHSILETLLRGMARQIANSRFSLSNNSSDHPILCGLQDLLGRTDTRRHKTGGETVLINQLQAYKCRC